MPRRKSTPHTSTGVAVNPFAGEEVSLLRALLQSTEFKTLGKTLAAAKFPPRSWA